MPKKKKIVIQYEALESLVEDGSKITTTPKAEEAIVALLTLQKQVDEAIDEARGIIAAAALKLNPNFSSIKSDKVKIAYKTYGQKYGIDETQVQFIPKELYKTTVKYSPDSKAIDSFLEEKGKLPVGIKEYDRQKTLSIKLVDEEE